MAVLWRNLSITIYYLNHSTQCSRTLDQCLTYNQIFNEPFQIRNSEFWYHKYLNPEKYLDGLTKCSTFVPAFEGEEGVMSPLGGRHPLVLKVIVVVVVGGWIVGSLFEILWYLSFSLRFMTIHSVRPRNQGPRFDNLRVHWKSSCPMITCYGKVSSKNLIDETAVPFFSHDCPSELLWLSMQWMLLVCIISICLLLSKTSLILHSACFVQV